MIHLIVPYILGIIRMNKIAKCYIQEKQLTSVMNTTKWKKFREAMIYEMPFCPPYILKTISNEDFDTNYFHHFSKDVSYVGDYSCERIRSGR